MCAVPPKKPPRLWSAKPKPINPENAHVRSTEAIASRAVPRVANVANSYDERAMREVASARLANVDYSQPTAQDGIRQEVAQVEQAAKLPPSTIARDVPVPDPWDTKEGYFQPDLFGGGTTIKQAYNPPAEQKNPNPGTSVDFKIEQIKQPYLPGMEPQHGVVEGAKWGWNHAMRGPGENGSAYSRSFIADTLTNSHPQDFREMPLAGKVGATAGRIAGDVAGYGSRHYLWNMHPEDMANTLGRKVVKDSGGSANAQKLAGYAGSVALGLGAMNYDPFNVEEGGRQKGFAAVSPTTEDPRESENAALDLVVHRGLFGRTGRLLPWEQFHQERPDVEYEKYAGYQEYLREPGILNLAKGTLDGVDGPEARIMGYRVTPGAVAAAAATIGGIAMLAKPRMARMMR